MPSMAPKIVTVDGAVLYGMRTVSRQYATSMGVVGYIKKIDDPLKDSASTEWKPKAKYS